MAPEGTREGSWGSSRGELGERQWGNGGALAGSRGAHRERHRGRSGAMNRMVREASQRHQGTESTGSGQQQWGARGGWGAPGRGKALGETGTPKEHREIGGTRTRTEGKGGGTVV